MSFQIRKVPSENLLRCPCTLKSVERTVIKMYDPCPTQQDIVRDVCCNLLLPLASCTHIPTDASSLSQGSQKNWPRAPFIWSARTDWYAIIKVFGFLTRVSIPGSPNDATQGGRQRKLALGSLRVSPLASCAIAEDHVLQPKRRCRGSEGEVQKRDEQRCKCVTLSLVIIVAHNMIKSSAYPCVQHVALDHSFLNKWPEPSVRIRTLCGGF